MLPEEVKQLEVDILGRHAGQLLRHSIYEFRYLDSSESQASVALLMPPSRPTWQDGNLFAVMDQNLPEGDLYLRLRALFPKQQLTPMHLLAMPSTPQVFDERVRAYLLSGAGIGRHATQDHGASGRGCA